MPVIVTPLSKNENAIAAAVDAALTAPADELWFVNVDLETVTVLLPKAKQLVPTPWAVLDPERRTDGKVHYRYRAVYDRPTIAEVDLPAHVVGLVAALVECP